MNTEPVDSRDLPGIRSVDPCHAHRAMQELYERTIMRFEYVSFSEGLAREDMRCRELPGLGLADITSLGVSTRRTARHVINDDLGLCITLSGQRLMRQRGREGIAEAGEAILLDGSEPSESQMSASRLFDWRARADTAGHGP
jgi:hypothetical protein